MSYQFEFDRNAAEADLHFNPKEQAIKRMFIHTTDGDANINTSKYSTLKHSFQSSNQSITQFQGTKTTNMSLHSISSSPKKFLETTIDDFSGSKVDNMDETTVLQDTLLNSSQSPSISLNQSRIDRLEASFTLKLSEFYQSLQPLDYQVLTNPSPPLRSIRDKMR